MQTNEPPKKLELVSTITTIVVNVGTILSWLFGLISALILASQPNVLTIPGINLQLDLIYQFVAILSTLLAYIHYLKVYWERNKIKEQFTDGFGKFMFNDLPKQQPISLIPFLFIFALMIKLGDLANSEKNILVTLLVIAFFGLCFALLVYFHGKNLIGLFNRFVRLGDKTFTTSFWDSDEALKQKWIIRIKKKLDEMGIVNTGDFHDEAGLSVRSDDAEINWALKMYFERFENEEELSLSSPSYTHNTEGYFYSVVLRKKQRATKKRKTQTN